MLSFSARLTRKFRNCSSGLAAVEFALFLPIMITMFFGMIEVADAVLADRRVTIATNNAADLAAQSLELTPQDIQGLFDASVSVLQPGNTDNITMTIVSVVSDSNDNPIVHWAVDKTGADSTEFPRGADFDLFSESFTSGNNGFLLNHGLAVIYVIIPYPYEKPFTHRFVDMTINFNQNSIRVPRDVPRVQLCDVNMSNCTS